MVLLTVEHNSITGGFDYRVTYYIDGVNVSSLLTTDHKFVTQEFDRLSRMTMGLAKGRVYCAKQSKH